MATSATCDAPERPDAPGRGAGGALAIMGALLLVGVRAASERSVMAEYGSDPQMGIWIMYLAVQLVFWLVTGLAAAGLVWVWRWGRRAALVLWFGWALAIGWSSWELQRYRQALADARNPQTAPARLQQLAKFTGVQAGYELDNRIAANPQTPLETLRTLYDRRNQGTLMVLARNPRTPADVLQAIADHDLPDQWIRSSLQANPQLPDTIRRRLDAVERP